MRKSSYSSPDDENCCEVAESPAEIHVRDSKDKSGTVLSFTPDAWRTALAWFSASDHGGRDHGRPPYCRT
ncbi:DUF397 domain-containing protein [Streptomyces sp. S.PB5]|uniref:DUF397 domain-containing protein n=1 Tax=Streptomyces sp. S.PB5 TaxID=3020844 RepID=UPI0025B1D58D|nr:DUF397 domain-containing protein [Streptomyces sp. S.PB5]MDN3023037.1 DUF397 domain-containing protein [Streptomyces sp. S.PB5]